MKAENPSCLQSVLDPSLARPLWIFPNSSLAVHPYSTCWVPPNRKGEKEEKRAARGREQDFSTICAVGPGSPRPSSPVLSCPQNSTPQLGCTWNQLTSIRKALRPDLTSFTSEMAMSFLECGRGSRIVVETPQLTPGCSDAQGPLPVWRGTPELRQSPPGGLETQMTGPCLQSCWYSKSGVEPENLHFSQVPR